MSMKSIRLFITAALLSLMHGTGEGLATSIYMQQSTKKIRGSTDLRTGAPPKLLKCTPKIHIAGGVVRFYQAKRYCPLISSVSCWTEKVTLPAEAYSVSLPKAM
jgi:hypothetical protein